MRIKSKKSWLLLLFAGLLTASLALMGCSTAEEISIAGSTTVQPLSEALRNEFKKDNDISITVAGGGSSVGVTSCNDGTVDIGAASRALKDSEPDLVVHTIARDGIAIVTHTSNVVDGLTLAQVRQIFTGDITNWSEVGGADHAIEVISREEGSGTRGAFEEMVMDDDNDATDDNITASALLFNSNGALHTAVSDAQWAIGFLSFGYLDSEVKALEIDGVAATVANAKNETYPVIRPLNYLTKEAPEGIVKDYIDFCLSSDGQDIVEDEGYIRVD